MFLSTLCIFSLSQNGDYGLRQRGCTGHVLNHWVDVFEHCGLDTYFSGQEHIYKRTWPIRDERVYVTTGLAGAITLHITTYRLDGSTLDNFALTKRRGREVMSRVLIPGKAACVLRKGEKCF